MKRTLKLACVLVLAYILAPNLFYLASKIFTNLVEQTRIFYPQKTITVYFYGFCAMSSPLKIYYSKCCRRMVIFNQMNVLNIRSFPCCHSLCVGAQMNVFRLSVSNMYFTYNAYISSPVVWFLFIILSQLDIKLFDLLNF